MVRFFQTNLFLKILVVNTSRMFIMRTFFLKSSVLRTFYALTGAFKFWFLQSQATSLDHEDVVLWLNIVLH
jgi:hypothetical protein